MTGGAANVETAQTGDSFDYGPWYKVYQGLYSLTFSAIVFFVMFRHWNTMRHAWLGVILCLGFNYVIIQAWAIVCFILPLQIQFGSEALYLRNLRKKVVVVPYADIREVRFRKHQGWEPSHFVAEVLLKASGPPARISSNVRQGPEKLAEAFEKRGIPVFNDTGYEMKDVR